ncbi:MAG: hypothetical protein ABSH52_12135 [Terriglobia bacterium]|jgi:hypothetical protein
MNGALKRRILQFAVLLSALGVAATMSLHAAPTPQDAAAQSEVAVGSASQQALISFLAAHIDIYSELLKQPDLIRNKVYLQRHPELAAFLKDHPEVAQRSSFAEVWPVPIEMGQEAVPFLGRETIAGPCGPALKIQALQNEVEKARSGRFADRYDFGDIGPFLVFVLILSALLWVFKVILDNRRWGKVAKVQAEVHSKLLEKFGNSQELLTYMGTEPGKRFLESQPFQLEAEGARPTPYPLGRMLFSMQLGVVLLLVGLGLLFLRSHVTEGAQGCLVLGTLASTVGIGFLLSTAASYGLSQHLGLLEGVTSRRQ